MTHLTELRQCASERAYGRLRIVSNSVKWWDCNEALSSNIPSTMIIASSHQISKNGMANGYIDWLDTGTDLSSSRLSSPFVQGSSVRAEMTCDNGKQHRLLPALVRIDRKRV